MHPVRTNRIADSTDFARHFGVSRETLARLEVYAQLLRTWQKTINLVAPSTLDEVWHRHFADSAQVMGLADGVSGAPVGREGHPLHWVDLGSGAGFPGLVVGILLAERGQSRLTLVDSDQRKAAFLREVVRATGLKAHITVDIVAERIESAANRSRSGGVDVVSARALAPLPRLLDWAEPYFDPATLGIFLKGREAEAEVAAAGGNAGWSFALHRSATDEAARIVTVRRTMPGQADAVGPGG